MGSIYDLLNFIAPKENVPPNMSVPPENYRSISQASALAPYSTATNTENSTSTRTTSNNAQQARNIINQIAPTTQIPKAIDPKKAEELKQKTGNNKKKKKTAPPTTPPSAPSNNTGTDVSTPKETEIDRELRKYEQTALDMADKIDSQNPALLDFQKQIVANKYNGVDISPLMAYFDAQLGTNTLKGYTPPTSDKADALLKEASKKYEDNASTAEAIRLNAKKIALETAKEKRKMELDQQLTQTKYLLDSNKLNTQQITELTKIGADYKATMAKLAQEEADRAAKAAKDGEKKPITSNPKLYEDMDAMRQSYLDLQDIIKTVKNDPSLVTADPTQKGIDILYTKGQGVGVTAPGAKKAVERYKLFTKIENSKQAMLKVQQGSRPSDFDQKKIDERYPGNYGSSPQQLVSTLLDTADKLGNHFNRKHDELSYGWNLAGIDKIDNSSLPSVPEPPQNPKILRGIIPPDTSGKPAPKKETPVFKDISQMTKQEKIDELARLKAENSKAGK